MAFDVDFSEKVKKLGFEVGWEADQPNVGAVKPGGAAHKRDVRAGDRLLEVNGASVVGQTPEELKVLLKARPLKLRLERPESSPGGGDAGSDSGSESDPGIQASPANTRHNADLALLSATKAEAAAGVRGKVLELSPQLPDPGPSGGYSQAAAPAAPAKGESDGEDSAEEADASRSTVHVTPDRFDRDMDLLHQKLRQKPVSPARPPDDATSPSKAAPSPQLSEASPAKPAEASQEADDTLAQQLQDEALAEQLQAEYDGEVVAEGAIRSPSESPGKRVGPPNLLAAMDAAAAAREAERLDEEDDDEAWQEEEMQHGAVTTPALMQIKVQVPDGVAAGDTIEVVAPSGDLVHVVVPAGHGPGSMLLVQVQGRKEKGPQNMLYCPVNERYPLEQWESRLQKLVNGYSCLKVARNAKLYQRCFWLAGGCLRTNGRFSSGADLKDLTGIFRGAVSQEFMKLRRNAAMPPQKSTSSLGASLLRRSFGGSKAAPPEHADPEEAGVVLLATSGRSFSLLFEGGAERDEFAETCAWAAQRVMRQIRAKGQR